MTAPTQTQTRPSGIVRNAYFTSPSTGILYWVDENGKASPVEEEVPDFQMCECELDWRCPLHQGQYTPLELMNDEWASRQADQDRFWQAS